MEYLCLHEMFILIQPVQTCVQPVIELRPVWKQSWMNYLSKQ